MKTSREIFNALMCRLERVACTYHADGRPASDELAAIGRDMVGAWAFMTAHDADRVYRYLLELERADALLQQQRENDNDEDLHYDRM